MTYVVALLRLLHIVSAFAWFGIGASMDMFVVPATVGGGPDGYRFWKSLYTKTRLENAFPIAASITVIAGILLYITGDTSKFTTTGNIVLGIGALFGIFAAGHGGAALGKATREFSTSLKTYVIDNQPIAADGLAILDAQIKKIAIHTRISFVLMLIALIGMGSARYL
jgi:hypothetical protein